jgi:hypothetical protein
MNRTGGLRSPYLHPDRPTFYANGRHLPEGHFAIFKKINKIDPASSSRSYDKLRGPVPQARSRSGRPRSQNQVLADPTTRRTPRSGKAIAVYVPRRWAAIDPSGHADPGPPGGSLPLLEPKETGGHASTACWAPRSSSAAPTTRPPRSSRKALELSAQRHRKRQKSLVRSLRAQKNTDAAMDRC